MSAPAKTEAKPEEGASAAAGPSGIKAWLPLILTLVLMPGLAYAMTSFVLLPKLQKGLGGGAAPETEEAAADSHGSGGHGAAEGGHGKSSGGHGKPAAGGSKGKIIVPMKERVLVNVSGTMGTRYLVANFTLMGVNAELPKMVEENEAQLRDITSSVLSNKTITDLEKPGARNLIRAELITAFNSVTGSGMVQEIYFTEFAVQ